jgi:hypothetical protein
VNEETSRRKNEEIKKRLSFFLSFFLTLRQFFWVCSLIVNAGYSQNSFLLKSGYFQRKCCAKQKFTLNFILFLFVLQGSRIKK